MENEDLVFSGEYKSPIYWIFETGLTVEYAIDGLWAIDLYKCKRTERRIIVYNHGYFSEEYHRIETIKNKTKYECYDMIVKMIEGYEEQCEGYED